jgi:NADH-quinone oxidoreductase subunit J
MTLNILLLLALVSAALWTIMTTRLLRSVVGLAITSIIVTTLLCRLNSPLAAVFELSVCGGLIPAIFLSAISLVKRLSSEALFVRRRERMRKYWVLPVLVVIVAVGLLGLTVPSIVVAAPAAPETDVRQVLWGMRNLDLLGQVAILLTGAFGIVSLLKEARKHE